MSDIDYTEKIATFNLLVGNNNEEVALNYLTLANWDETKAAMLYNQENKGAEAKLQSNINAPINQNNPIKNNIDNFKDNDIDNFDMPLNCLDTYYYTQNYRDPKINYKLNKYPECRIFTKGLIDALKIFKIDNRGYFPAFGNITQKCIKLYDVFINNLRTNVGLILIYNKKTYNDAVNIVRKLNENDLTKDLINSKTVILPLISGCLEADQITKDLKIKNFPTILICFYKNHMNFAVIAMIHNIMNNIKLLTEKLIEAHDLFNDGKKYKDYPMPNSKKNNIINNNNKNNNIINNNNNKDNNLLNDINNYLPDDINNINNINRDSYSNMTDGEILAKQENEMKKLEKMEENKKLEEAKKEREKKEEEERKKEEELIEKIKADSILNLLPKEPDDDNPDKCVILFRFPDGEKVVQRKFLKTEKVSVLYLYIQSLGREIYSEKEEKKFSLIQTFPFKNFDEIQNNTLEQEGLFPNGMLQIRTSIG